MTLILHHLNLSRSERIIWLMEELGVDYELKRYARNAETMLAPPELLDLHPMGKAPLLEHKEIILAESIAIAFYLLDNFDPDYRLHPAPNSRSYATFLEWVQASEGSVFLPFLMNIYLTAAGLQDSLLSQWMSGERTKAVKFIENHLTKQNYFAGSEFSAADIMMGFQLEALDARGGLNDTSPIKSWLERIRTRTSYKNMRKVTSED